MDGWQSKVSSGGTENSVTDTHPIHNDRMIQVGDEGEKGHAAKSRGHAPLFPNPVAPGLAPPPNAEVPPPSFDVAATAPPSPNFFTPKGEAAAPAALGAGVLAPAPLFARFSEPSPCANAVFLSVGISQSEVVSLALDQASKV